VLEAGAGNELVELETAHSRRDRQSISRLFRAGLTTRGFRRKYVMRDQLPNVRVPTTFLWGEPDAFMTPEEGGVAARLVAGGRFEVISGAGHLPSTDQPEATAALLEAALGAR
jgi:pimeloyl-ACP methyl ester carboxylesterase